MRISQNLASLNVYRSYLRTIEDYTKSSNRISSGTKISKAKDNPNKLAQSERIRLEARSLNMASRNVQDAVSMIQSSDGTMKSVSESLTRLRELAIRGGSGTLADDDRKSVELEMDEILKGIKAMTESGDFNGVNILADKSVLDNSNPNSIRVTVGGNVGENAYINSYNLTPEALGLMDEHGSNLIDLTNIDDALDKIEVATKTVAAARSNNGAKQNRFESMLNNLIEIRDRNVDTDSKIRDTDVAQESARLTRASILLDTSNAIMAQTNRFPQEILRVLENVRSR